ncbi:hypothetical protein TNCV_664761 [Trichonephila clavipes]|nr:hypothetical protein TNCV_664761 [Trichonephila clavipes]
MIREWWTSNSGSPIEKFLCVPLHSLEQGVELTINRTLRKTTILVVIERSLSLHFFTEEHIKFTMDLVILTRMSPELTSPLRATTPRQCDQPSSFRENGPPLIGSAFRRKVSSKGVIAIVAPYPTKLELN